MIAPRRTRLVRVRGLQAFRAAMVSLSENPSGPLFVLPTVAAAHQLRRLFRDREATACLTRDEWYDELHRRLVDPPRRLSPFEREALARSAANEAAARLGFGLHASSTETPGGIRPALVSELLRFYDQLCRQGQPIDRFETLLVDTLERDAEFDRGAERMLRQTRFLAEAFRGYERRLAETRACDEHVLRARLMAEPSAAPIRGVVVTVADWIADPAGLYVADFDLLTRLPGLETIDLVATETVLASGFHQRVHDWLPGIEEIDFEHAPGPRPRLLVPPSPQGQSWFTVRDREEELISIARRLDEDGRRSSDRAAIVYKRPLPYLYLARDVFGSAGIAYQTSDALPLAAEPFTAALDLLLECVSSSFTRSAIIALLRSPHFELGGPDVSRGAIAALDRTLSELRYLGDFDRLVELPAVWPSRKPHHLEARPALDAAIAAARLLAALRSAAPVSTQIEVLMAFLEAHDLKSEADPASRAGRGRSAVVNTLRAIADASGAYDDRPVDVDTLRTMIRRWIEEQTFAPDLPAAGGPHLVDDIAAPFGDFDSVAIVGMIEGEWPERPLRNIFYTPTLLAALGWPPEKDWRAAMGARFIDLLSSASEDVALSTITLDDEALVQPSPLLEEVPRAGLQTAVRDPAAAVRLFPEEFLSRDPVTLDRFEGERRNWAELRLARTSPADPGFHGQAGGQPSRTWTVSALETYLDCPFKFFARYVLNLEEEPDDEEVMDPRREGQFVHEVFERFFAAWQAGGHQAIHPDNLDEARALFERVVDQSLNTLSETEAGLERTRLLGSSAAAGLGEAVLRMEAERPIGVAKRLLEYPLNGTFTFDTPDGPRAVALKGKADRIDLLEDGTLRVIDYKLGWPPNRARALQLPIYSLCAEQLLNRDEVDRSRPATVRDPSPPAWTIGEAAYLAFKGPKRVVPLFPAGERDRVLGEAQQRLVDTIDAVARGDFPPRPHDVYRCETCAYTHVCRTDYVDDV